MVKLTGTITAVSVLSGGLWALCASTFATKGWTAPACIAAGFSSTVGLVLGIVQDKTEGHTKEGGNNPDKTNKVRDAARWHRIHDDGWLENYDGRLYELYGTNETHNIVDLSNGYHHTVSMKGENVVVKTDFTQKGALCSSSAEGEDESLGQLRRRRMGGFLERRLTKKQKRNELTDATLYAQKIGSVTSTDTKRHENQLGRDIANQAYKLGTWCMSIHKGGANAQVIADMGITLGGQGYDPTEIEPPCRG